ncbi:MULTISPECIES: hypothetical protein [Rhodococcus]|uniref:hypothetical protein n=1 Tax=Rhodococcus TaxID=1827 RepID=UPI001E5C29E9|nr:MULTISPECIES: hypothetical protein [Rhodococcus]BDB58983.1 hypothetical protein RDE2_07770 [Rhodococcus sp. RDE2]
MPLLATTVDVEMRLGRELTDEDAVRVEGLLEEASELVASVCRPLPTPTPDAVRIVTSRIVARALDSDIDTPGVESTQMSAGSFQLSQNYTGDSTAGGPWLSRSDRRMLRRWRRGVVNVATW